MRDWNVVVTVSHVHFRSACQLLGPLGPLRRTRFYNTLAMKVADVQDFLATIDSWKTTNPEVAESRFHLAPVTDRFVCRDADEFRAQADLALLQLTPQLAGKRFHVRAHTRGLKLSRSAEERRLGGVLLDELKRLDVTGRVGFGDPDAIIDFQTIDDRGGLALWTRADLSRYSF
jgi:hypothetical protein